MLQRWETSHIRLSCHLISRSSVLHASGITVMKRMTPTEFSQVWHQYHHYLALSKIEALLTSKPGGKGATSHYNVPHPLEGTTTKRSHIGMIGRLMEIQKPNLIVHASTMLYGHCTISLGRVWWPTMSSFHLRTKCHTIFYVEGLHWKNISPNILEIYGEFHG